MTQEYTNAELLEMSTDIVAAYVSNNAIASSDLPGLMKTIHSTVKDLANGEAPPEKLEPAVPIKKSLTRDHIICLEDGAKLKMLKRYLRTRYGMTPDEYRKKWGLDPDYPMVAPEYAERRSEFAKKIGLGKTREDA